MKTLTPAIKGLFWAMGVLAVFIVIQLTVEPVQEFFSGGPFLFLAPAGVLLILGVILAIKARKLPKPMRIYLEVVGLSGAAFLIFVILHNVFYAIGTVVTDSALHAVLGFFEAAFFLLGVPVTPIVFIVAYILAVKKMLKK